MKTETPRRQLGHGGEPGQVASPPARRLRGPSWLDLRLITGVLLVLGAVLAGAGIVSSADRRSSTWVLRHDVSAGTVLAGDDIGLVRVALGSSASGYLSGSESPVGKVVTQPLRSGQLLPRAAVEPAATGVAVTVPVRPENMPRLARGDRVTLWVSTRTCKGRVLLSGVPVQEVRSIGAGAFTAAGSSVLVVRLPAAEAARVVGVLDLDGLVVRVGALAPGEPAADDGQSLTACGVEGR